MGIDTKIEWTDATWNCLRGCSVVSEGCRNCYAMQVAARFSGLDQAYEGLAYRNQSGAHWTGEVRVIQAHMEDPLRWRQPRRIFVNSMSDLFHESLEDNDIDDVFAIMAMAKHHAYQILTKRPERMFEYMTSPGRRGDITEAVSMEAFDWYVRNCRPLPAGMEWDPEDASDRDNDGVRVPELPWPLPNVWLGTSCENQKTADERIPWLLKTPAAVRWLSCEPLLGPIDLGDAHPCGYYCDPVVSEDSGYVYGHHDHDFKTPRINTAITWVVVGGESGHGARPMHPDWARSLRDQCVAAGVPFFFKQHGEWIGADQRLADGTDPVLSKHETHHRWPNAKPPGPPSFGMNYSIKVGKKAAGRLLDGREWNGYPEEAKAVTA